MTSSIETFFDAWSVAQADARLAAVQSAVVEDAIYADPRTSEPLSGPAAIAKYVGMFVEMAPGASATVVNTQTQAGMTRVTVAFRMADGTEQLGQYFVELSGEGKITRMIGFVGIGAAE